MDFEKYLLNEVTKKMSIEQVADEVNKDGIGYAISNYVSWKDIEDKKLAALWKQAAESIYKVEKMLEKYLDYTVRKPL